MMKKFWFGIFVGIFLLLGILLVPRKTDLPLSQKNPATRSAVSENQKAASPIVQGSPQFHTLEVPAQKSAIRKGDILEE